MVKFLSIAFFLLLVAGAEAQTNLNEWVRQSSFIFQGTVLKLKASTMDIVPAADDTIVVRLDETLKTPSELGDLRGKELTIKVKHPDALKENQSVIFFARGWLLGDGIALQEVGSLSESSMVEIRKQIQSIHQSNADQDLGKRLSEAHLVVVGKVSRVSRVNEKPDRISEHSPLWEEAIVKIDSVLKGNQGLKSVVVHFPGTEDIAWHDVKKFKEGDQGIWILNAQRGDEEASQFYTALDPLDFQPMSELDRVRQLIRDFKKSPQ